MVAETLLRNQGCEEGTEDEQQRQARVRLETLKGAFRSLPENGRNARLHLAAGYCCNVDLGLHPSEHG